MQSIPAYFNGKTIVLEKKIKLPKNARLLVTLVEDDADDLPATEIVKLADKAGAFDFLNDTKEDIYTDDDLKVRY